MRSFILLCSILTGHVIAYSQILIKDINPVPSIGSVTDKFNMIEMNNKVYFNADDGIHGMELWTSDGTEAGTHLVKDINTATNFGGVNFDGVFEQWTPVFFNNKIYFSASGSGGTGIELWVSDGTEAGTQLLHDIRTIEPTSSYAGGHNCNNYFVYDGYLWFSAVDNDFFTGLWRTDGTSAGTALIKQLESGNINVSSMTLFDNKVWFACDDKLWSSDGTEAGTVMVQAFESLTFGRKDEMKVLGNALYFCADNGTTGKELWKIDINGNVSVLDVVSGSEGITPVQLTVLNNMLYFVGYDATHLTELWKTDGTLEGTIMVTEINPNGSAYINFPQDVYSPLTIYNDELWFSAFDDSHGRELWRSDGTAAGTVRVTDLTDANVGSTPSKFVIHNNKLFFSANYSFEGRQLHSYDALNDELTTYWQDGYNDLACCVGNMFSIAGELFMPGNYDFDDVIRDELYKLGSPVSLVEVNHHNSFIQVFPSPARESVRVVTQQMKYPLTVSITSVSGKLVYQKSILSQQNDLSVAELAKGMYIFTIADNDRNIASTRLIKE